MITRLAYEQLKGLPIKKPCRVATTEDITLSSGPTSIDGVNLVVGDRVLVYQQNSASENGIYIVASISAKYTSAGQSGKDILAGAPNNWTITDGDQV